MANALKRFLYTDSYRDSTIWMETVLVAAATLLLGQLFSPDDPLFIRNNGFAWSALAPVLIGLRYGFTQAFSCALIILFFSYLLAQLGNPPWLVPLQYSIGLLIAGSVAGEFRDIWERRLRQLEMDNRHHMERLQEFTRAYHILKHSHDKLEQQSAGKVASLRNAVSNLQHELASMDSGAAVLENSADTILNICKRFGNLQTASLHRVTDNRVAPQALAAIGSTGSPSPDDPLIDYALETGKLTSLKHWLTADEKQQYPSDYLAVVPLVDIHGRIHALLLIRDMPFFAFNSKNLQLLAILGGRIADILRTSERHLASPESQLQNFSFHLQRSIHDAVNHDLSFSIIAMRFARDELTREFFTTILPMSRSMDVYAMTRDTQGRSVLLVLLPLSEPSGNSLFLARLERVSKEQYGIDFDSPEVEIFQQPIDGDTRSKEVRNFLHRTVGIAGKDLKRDTAESALW